MLDPKCYLRLTQKSSYYKTRGVGSSSIYSEVVVLQHSSIVHRLEIFAAPKFIATVVYTLQFWGI
jgi:hypothetical protein